MAQNTNSQSRNEKRANTNWLMNITKTNYNSNEKLQGIGKKDFHINSLKGNKEDNKNILSYLTGKKDKSLSTALSKEVKGYIRKESDNNITIANFINDSKIFKSYDGEEDIMGESLLFPVDIEETYYEVKEEHFVVNSENL
jgi:hypothetical protein